MNIPQEIAGILHSTASYIYPEKRNSDQIINNRTTIMRDVMLFFHFIGLAMGIGTGFAHAFLGAASAKMPAAEATKFRLSSLVLSNMGNTGIVLLLISGFYLITPYWKVLGDMPLLIVKLSLVLILTIIIIAINMLGQKAKKGDPEVQFKKMAILGKMTLIISLAIVLTAVKVFH